MARTDSHPEKTDIAGVSVLLAVPLLASLDFVVKTDPELLPAGWLDSAPVFFLRLTLGLLLTAGVVSLPLALLMCAVQRTRKKVRRSPLLAAARLSLVVITTVLASQVLRSFIPRGLPAGSYERRFDAAVWKDPRSAEFGKEISARERMLGDLVVNVLPGKSRQEITELLGPSLDTPYFRESNKDFIYYLGRQRDSGINIDSEWLLLWVDADGRYHRYKVVND